MVEIPQDGTRVARVGDRVELTYGCYKPFFAWNGTTVTAKVFRGHNTPVLLEPEVTVGYPKLGRMEGMVVISDEQSAALGVGEFYVPVTIERESPAFGPFTPVTLLLKLIPNA